MFDQLHLAGFSVIPTKEKRPLIKSWAEFQTRKPTDQEHFDMSFSHGGAIICSGDVFCIDLDTKNDKTGLIQRWKNLVEFFDDKLLKKLYCESTPSGGFHLVFRCDIDSGNEQWAYDKDQKSPCIETRAKGGYFVTAPTEGYKTLRGDILSLEKLTLDEFEILKNCAKDLDQKKKIEDYLPRVEKEGVRPLDDYDSKHGETDIIEMMISHGWKVSGKKGEVTYLARPGKQKGISASVGGVEGRLYVFSSSTEFEAGKSYKPSSVLCTLEYASDYRECARALSREGYGEKTDSRPIGTANKASLSDIGKEMLKVQAGDFPKGISTGWKSMDFLYKVSDHQLNIVTGIPSHGKSTFIDNLLVNLARNHGWKFLVYSPESYPLSVHFRSLVQKYIHENVEGGNKQNILRGVEFVEKHFKFVDCSEEVNLDQILALAKSEGVNGLLIDPWNELDTDRPIGISETDYIKIGLKKIRTFARNNKINTWIVTHPQKLLRDKDGKYPIPTLYDISGSAHWYNKADNGFTVYQNEQGETEIHVTKMKVSYYGQKGKVSLKYVKGWQGYEDLNDYQERQLWNQ